jgi:hypothetical protein
MKLLNEEQLKALRPRKKLFRYLRGRARIDVAVINSRFK